MKEALIILLQFAMIPLGVKAGMIVAEMLEDYSKHRSRKRWQKENPEEYEAEQRFLRGE